LLVYLILAEHVLVLMRTCLTKINETAQDWIVSQLPISDIMCRLQSAFAPKPRVTLICFSFPQFSCPYWTSGRSRWVWQCYRWRHPLSTRFGCSYCAWFHSGLYHRPKLVFHKSLLCSKRWRGLQGSSLIIALLYSFC